MKKNHVFILGIIATACLVGCEKSEIPSNPINETLQTESTMTETIQSNEESDFNWGIDLSVEDVQDSGLTIVCNQKDGEPSGDLQTGSYYVLEVFNGDKWESVPTQDGKEVSWTEEAWVIPMNETVKWTVDWEWLYGKLPAGHYRIGKKIMDFIGTGNYNEQMFYAEFVLE